MKKIIITITDRQGKPRKITIEEDPECCNFCSLFKLSCDKLQCPEKTLEFNSLFEWCADGLKKYGSSNFIPENLFRDYPELILKYRRPWKKR